jgi:hypothetical protein
MVGIIEEICLLAKRESVVSVGRRLRVAKAVGHPDLSGCPDVVFTREELDIVMGRAFARLMGLPGESQAAGRQ